MLDPLLHDASSLLILPVVVAIFVAIRYGLSSLALWRRHG